MELGDHHRRGDKKDCKSQGVGFKKTNFFLIFLDKLYLFGQNMAVVFMNSVIVTACMRSVILRPGNISAWSQEGSHDNPPLAE